MARPARLVQGDQEHVLRGAGQTLVKYRPNTGPVMVKYCKYWPNDGQIPAKYWSNTGQILVKYWPNTGQMLVKCWPNAGQILAKYWPNAGQILAKSDRYWPKYK
jgi:hypothetical protein